MQRLYSASPASTGAVSIAASLRPRAMRPDATFEGLRQEFSSFGLTWSWDSSLTRDCPRLWRGPRIPSWSALSLLEQQLLNLPVGRGLLALFPRPAS